MNNLLIYPYPTYIPNRVVAGSVAGVACISLIAWFIQSCQLRFRPPRICILLLISHLTIFLELIVRAVVDPQEQNSKTVFTVLNSLFAIGQRMIIVSNFAFVMEIHHEKSRRSHAILLGAILCVVTSGILMAPANMLSFNSDQIKTSFIFRELSASILLTVTLLFYPVWFWSKTINDMKIKAIILMSVSSTMCIIVAAFNVAESTSDLYTGINDNEKWFYAFQMAPLIIAHFTWSICHPKRSLISLRTLITKTNSHTTLIEEENIPF
ncbi:unnamed protein product [Adineta steineri]|uniref:Uncharacterized protein n=1 Tax=Adineta steineri TaxID=433720 RepID=A0A814JD61_9BILA|nr:unnamed protein product [Adineta steineri]